MALRTTHLENKAEAKPLPFEDVKAHASVTRYFEDHFRKVGKTFECPLCGSGTGPNRSPALKVYEDENRWYCFACQKGGDVLDLAGIAEHTTDRREQLEAVARWAGITFEAGPSSAPAKAPGEPQAAPAAAPAFTPTAPAPADPAADEATIEREAKAIASAKAALWSPGGAQVLEYARSRGFTDQEIEAFGFGSAYGFGARRLVIPWRAPDSWYHTDRRIDGDGKPKYTKPEGLSQPQLFDASNLEGGYFFLCEGPLDAYSIIACGHPAEALGSSGSNKLLARLTKDKGTAPNYDGCVIIALDNDEITEGEAGRRKGPDHAAELEEKLKAAGVKCINVVGESFGTGSKDAGEALQKDRAALTAWLDAKAEQARQIVANAKAEDFWQSMAAVNAQGAAAILGGLVRGERLQETVPTGIKALDRVLAGGLHPGLTVLAGYSSMGKTELMTQVADQIAASGRGVLFASIEQEGRELVGRSLVRIARKLTGRITFSSSDLYDLRARASWGEGSQQVADFKAAAEEYSRTIAPRLTYAGGDGVPTIGQLERAARLMADVLGKPPIILIDYLQLLPPINERDDEIRAINRNVTELRHVANRLNTVVFALSAMSRASYKEEIGMSSFRGSSSIEYSSDCALGLQPRGFKTEIESGRKASDVVEEAKKGPIGRLEIKVIKSRSWRLPNDPVPVDYERAAHTFTDATG